MTTPLNNPLVSIVIATYNGERFLKEQLDSIINQTYKNIEIIAVDDCSSDNTSQILNDYANRYDNFTAVINDSNLGYQKNFEKGFLLAKGDYIAPSDQDDSWLANKIEVLVNNIEGYAIVYCDSAFMNSEGVLIGQKMSEAKVLMDFDDPLMFVLGGSVPGHAMLITKQLVLDTLPFPATIMPHDYWLAYVATFKSSLKFINQVLVHYRRHDHNIFGAINKKNKVRESTEQRINNARIRMQLLYEKCPDDLIEHKQVLARLCQSYQSYSLSNNFTRAYLFFKYRDKILSYKKRSDFRRCLFCLKAFFKIM